jgi:hypothetical protein
MQHGPETRACKASLQKKVAGETGTAGGAHRQGGRVRELCWLQLAIANNGNRENWQARKLASARAGKRENWQLRKLATAAAKQNPSHGQDAC